MNEMKNTPGHMMVWAFLIALLSMQGAIGASLDRELRTNPEGISLQPHELFARRDISSASGIYEFVNNTVNAAQGICNVDKGRLPSNEIFIFNEVSIGFTAGANAGLVGSSLYETAPSVQLRNAEFEIRQGGRLVLNYPVASLCNPHTGTSTQDDFACLGSICYLRDDQDFTISFKFPNGVSIPAGGAGTTSYAEVRLRGHRTVRKG